MLQHLPLARAVARRFWRPGLDRRDLEQAAAVGLLQAARRFRREAGTRFSTFAVPYIVGEIRRFLQTVTPLSGTASARELVRRAEHCRQQLELREGAPPSLARVARELGVPPAELACAQAALLEPLPMEEAVCAAEARHDEGLAVRSALQALPDPLRTILYLRFYAGLTQQEVARLLGRSQPVISRLEHAALSRLRQNLEEPPAPHHRRPQLPEGGHGPAAKAAGDGPGPQSPNQPAPS